MSDALERVAVLRKRARSLRAELPEIGKAADAANVDAAEGMRRLWEEGFFEFHLPTEYGGLSGASADGYTEDFIAMLVDIVAGDTAVGQNFVAQSVVTIETFGRDNGLPDSTKQEMARLIRDEGVRIVGSNAETGVKTGPVTARPVAGGVVVTGTKTFNTNSGGGGWANISMRMEGEEGRWHALVPLDHEAVTCHHDWDVMGQRGTHSQTIDYQDVFVADGYYYRAPTRPYPLVTMIFLVHAALMLGSGYGAFDAVLDYVRRLDRPSVPEFGSADADPLIRRRVGGFAVDLEAARSYLLTCAEKVETWESSYDSGTEATIDAFGAKVACVRAALRVTHEIFELTGARSTAQRYGFDRFWRNARTFSTHDPTDAKELWIGDWYLHGQEPPTVAMLRL